MKFYENERIDDLEYNNLKIIQNKKGFCFGIDSVLISDFAKDIKKGAIGVDLGTGTGIISILLTSKTGLSKIWGIEIQKDVADMARRSIKLNNLENKVNIIDCDIKDIMKENIQIDYLKRETQDFIITNPPYKKLQTGKVNETEYKYISRHEVTANLEDFIMVSKFLLRDRGSFFMVHRPDRLVDIIELMRKYKIEPKKIRFVYSYINKEPRLVLIKGVKNAKPFLKIEKPLIIYKDDGDYTEEIYKIYGK